MDKARRGKTVRKKGSHRKTLGNSKHSLGWYWTSMLAR